MTEIKTYSHTVVSQQRNKGNKLWKEIYSLIQGKKFPAFERVSIRTPFASNGFTEMQVNLVNGFFSQGKLRVFLKNERGILGVNLRRGFISPIGDQTFVNQLEVYELRVKIFEVLKPVIESLRPIMIDSSKTKRV
jgi:hypothetical protein